MAWVRTSTSMIAFGFGIYQFLEYLTTKEQLRQPLISPQLFAALLIVTGWDKLIETALVNASPAWLNDLTTRF